LRMLDLTRLVVARLAFGLLTLLIVSSVIFLSVTFLPGDFAQSVLGNEAPPEAIAVLRHELGLDQPPLTRYVSWLSAMLQGNLGHSLVNQVPVMDLVSGRLANTMILAGLAAMVAVPLALTIGILAALNRNSTFDRLANILALGSISFPEFFIAYLLILVFSVELDLLPSVSKITSNTAFAEQLYRSVLPALTLTVVVTAQMMRMTRAAIVNVLSLPYIEMARLKGVSQLRVVVHHALPNAIAPIANVIAMNLAYLISGVVIVEVVFVYPGLGQLLVDSVAKRDMPVVQAACLVFAIVYIVLNLTADIVSIAANPRLLRPR
jgi:peptide/nickel transport system permease protein